MRRKSNSASWHRPSVFACLVIAGCTTMPPAQVGPPAKAPKTPPALLAQVGHGRQAVFGVCRGEECPQRTPKTRPAPAPATTAPAQPAGPMLALLPDGHADAVAGDREPLRASAALTARPALSLVPAQRLSVHFPFASARLDATARRRLREAAPQLSRARRIVLSGRTDSTGPTAANDRLAQARAEAVRGEILAHVPDAALIVTIDARGACCFVEPNDSPSGRARNRRVEIRYLIESDHPP